MTATKCLSMCCFISLLIVPLVLLPTPASAQFNSTIQGTVSDAQKGVLPGATVKVTNIATGQARETTTSADGVYTVVSLAVGTYRVQVELDGFQVSMREVSVGISETARGDFTLEVSGLTERVTVAAAAALVETTQGRISGRVDRTQLQEMPLNGRNVYNLIALQPGVTGKGVSSTFGAGGNGNDSFSGESAPRINAGGQRDEANSFTLDDTSTNGVARGGITNLTPNAESVEEIRVVANNFSAVDGRNSGAQIQVISKGGTNTFHGSASFYYQDENFTTKNVFETAVPEFSKKQFGYSFGGPIMRNRLFFFTSYEGLRQAGGRGSSFTVETPEYRNFVARTYPNSIAAKLFTDYQPGAYPTSNFRDTGSPVPGGSSTAGGAPDGIMDVGAAFFIPTVWRDGNQFNVRTDYDLRPGKDRLYANFYRTTSLTNNGGIRPYFDYPVKETTYFGNLNHTHVFSGTKLNEFRAGMMQLIGRPQVPLEILGIPGITITGISGFGGSSYPRGWDQSNWHFKNIFTAVKGGHTVKTGGELRRMYGSAVNTTNYIPAYQFFSIHNFAVDTARQMNRYVDPRTGQPATAYSELIQTEWALFWNDDWRVNDKLTINAGVRYENYGTFVDPEDTLRNLILSSSGSFNEQLATAKVDVVDRFYAPDNNNVAPRLGFAWDPKGDAKTAVRGGYAIAYDRLMNLPAENYRHSPPFRAQVSLGEAFGTPFTYSLGDPSKPNFGYPVDAALQTGLDERNGVRGARVSLTTVDPGLVSPYAHTWFLGMQREIMWNLVADANYFGSLGRNLHNAYNVNRYVGDMLDGRFNGFNPSFATINHVTSTSKSEYNGLSLSIRRPFKNSYMFQASYTFGKAMNDTDQAVGATNTQDAANLDAEWAVAGYDVTHKLSFVAMWEMPFFRNSAGLTRTLLGGWQLQGYGIFQTGNPINVTNSAAYPAGDYNADNNAGDRPNAPSGVKTSGWSNDEYLAGIFKASDFPRPAAGTNGNLPRNAYRGPGFSEVSLSLAKKFALSGSLNAEVRLDAFNVFNTVNLGDPVMDLSNVNFGKSTSQLATRAMQFGLRLRF
jgi:Carboxypeptidase regulatory-like domain